MQKLFTVKLRCFEASRRKLPCRGQINKFEAIYDSVGRHTETFAELKLDQKNQKPTLDGSPPPHRTKENSLCIWMLLIIHDSYHLISINWLDLDAGFCLWLRDLMPIDLWTKWCRAECIFISKQKRKCETISLHNFFALSVAISFYEPTRRPRTDYHSCSCQTSIEESE